MRRGRGLNMRIRKLRLTQGCWEKIIIVRISPTQPAGTISRRSQPRRSFAFSTRRPDDQREHEQSKGQGHGGEREGGSGLVSHYADHLTGLSDKGLAAIGGTSKVGAQVVGEKLLLGLGGGTVGLDTEKDVFAGLRPRGLCVPLVDHPAKGVVASGRAGGIAHLAMEMADEQVAGASGAVVVEVVVAIDNVLGRILTCRALKNGFLVGIVEVENLLADGALLVFVLGAKEPKGHHAQLVVGEAEDKAQDEIGRVGG